MADKPKPKSASQSDKEVRQFISKGGRAGAEKDFNKILRRAANQPKKK